MHRMSTLAERISPDPIGNCPMFSGIDASQDLTLHGKPTPRTRRTVPCISTETETCADRTGTH